MEGGLLERRLRYRFTHRPEANVVSVLSDETWRQLWDDVLTDYGSGKAAGNSDGFVWGVNWADGYPGLSYVADSAAAVSWTERLGREMHGIALDEHIVLRLVCHDLRVQQLARGVTRLRAS